MVRTILVLAAVTILTAGASPLGAAEPETEAANAAVDYIIGLQNPDGGFPAFGDASAAGSTIDAVFALVAVGRDATAVTADGNSPADYLATQAAEYAEDPGAAAKLALAVSAMGLDLTDFGGVDLTAFLDDNLDAESGSYGLDVFDEAFFVLALVGEGEPAPTMTTEHLCSLQQGDGGWEYLPGEASDTNTTAVALQAMIAALTPADDPAVAAALGYLHESQNADGGFGFLPGEESDANTTAFVIQGLIAAGEDIDAGGPWAADGATPLDGLLSFRNAETGAFQFFGEDSAFATYQAVPGLMLAPFPDLETKPDGEPPPAPATAVDSPTPAATDTPLPAATPTDTATATATSVPAATTTEEPPVVLPSVGGGPGGGASQPWIVLGLLGIGGAALGLGASARRHR